MSEKQPNKPLTARGIDTMKLGMTLADTGENRGLRVTRGKWESAHFSTAIPVQ